MKLGGPQRLPWSTSVAHDDRERACSCGTAMMKGNVDHGRSVTTSAGGNNFPLHTLLHIRRGETMRLLPSVDTLHLLLLEHDLRYGFSELRASSC